MGKRDARGHIEKLEDSICMMLHCGRGRGWGDTCCECKWLRVKNKAFMYLEDEVDYPPNLRGKPFPHQIAFDSMDFVINL